MKGHKFMNYKHITINERCYIENFLGLNRSLRKIANHLDRNVSTTSREIKRNSVNGKYFAHIDSENYGKRRLNCGTKPKSTNIKLLNYIKDALSNA